MALKNSSQPLSNKIQNEITDVITLNINFVMVAVLQSDFQHKVSTYQYGKHFSQSYE